MWNEVDITDKVIEAYKEKNASEIGFIKKNTKLEVEKTILMYKINSVLHKGKALLENLVSVAGFHSESKLVLNFFPLRNDAKLGEVLIQDIKIIYDLESKEAMLVDGTYLNNTQIVRLEENGREEESKDYDFILDLVKGAIETMEK